MLSSTHIHRTTFTRNIIHGLRWVRFSSSNNGLDWTNPSPTNNKKALQFITSEYLVKILTSRVYEVASETPTTYAASLSAALNNEIFIKREDLQPVFSFKIRGAHNKIANLSAEQLERGVVTCSAGNHAQGVALSAKKLGVKATIVMPQITPSIKVSAVKRFGGESGNVQVVLHGNNYDEAAAEAKRLEMEEKYTMVHPFDDEYVIAGQGTIGMEILKKLQGQELDSIFVCTGGGGMLAGIASYIKAVRPEVKVIGVEAADAAGMTTALQAGRVVTLPHVGLFADGAAVRTVGTETFRLSHALVDGMVTVSTDEICAAIKSCFNDTRCIMEPAGALGIAGMRKYIEQSGITGKSMVAITSGANMDFDRLRFVSERADSSEMLLSITIPEKPGAFREFYRFVYPRNVTEYSYRHNGTDKAVYIVSLQPPPGISKEQDKEQLLHMMTQQGYQVTDLGDNELAKVHVRHMAGGRAANPLTEQGWVEVLYRFEFPESPGALGRFLSLFTDFGRYTHWTMSLFHYRNHGHDYGRVLVGIYLHESEKPDLNEFLKKLNYVYHEEHDNAVYNQFLK